MFHKNRRLIALLFLFVPCFVFAQKYSFKNFSIEQGLPQAYIYSMFQNPEGYLIVSTGKGNVSFNGTDFKPLLTPNLAAEDFVTASFIDQTGSIWFGCFSGTILVLSGNNESKMVYKAASSISHFCESKNGLVVASTRSSGLVAIDNSKFSAQAICADCEEQMINSAEFIDRNLLLIASNSGLYTYSFLNRKMQVVTPFASEEITCLLLKKKRDGCWVGTKEKGVYELTFTESQSLVVVRNISKETGLSGNSVQCIFEEKQGTLWVATLEGGIHKLVPAENYRCTFYQKEQDLGNEFVKVMLQDAEENLWLGTYGGGLFRMDIDPFELVNVKNGLSDNKVLGIVSDKQNNLWFAGPGGISLRYKKSGETKQITTDRGLISNAITCLYLDEKNKKLWYGTADKGIGVLDMNNLHSVTMNDLPNLTGDYINSISADKFDNIWISTTLSGVYKYDGNFSQFSTKNGLGHNYVFQSYGDSKGRVWFATHAAALNYFEKSKIKEQTGNLGISSYDFNSFCEDKNGNIWTATFGNGFANISITPKVVITTADALISNYCYGILCDRDNNLWVTQKNYLTKYNPIRQNIKTFSGKDLFGDNQFNTNALHLDREGNVWFGTDKGALCYLYSSYSSNKIEAKPKITAFKVFNEKKDINSYLTLPFGSYSVSFEFEALSFKKSEEVKFKYMLLGRDNEWQYAGNSPVVHYANLKDGNYSFRLMACNNDGLWNAEPVEISFTVAAPLWKSWWFWTLLLSLLVLLTATYVNLRAKQLKRQRDELQRMVDNKTKELSQEKSLVESQNKIIRAKNKDIQDSINYAQKIQDAILPDMNELKKSLSDVFILYKPREVVSGDFYWYTHVDNSMIIVAADCTGHGVPGALMSMIGNALLREIILLNQIYTPNSILYALDEGIISTLNQGGAEKERKDGMAISICKINADKKEIHFASSQQSLIHISKNKATEVKGEFFSIGDYEVTDKRFENHRFSYEKEDMIYLFSDGYLDQFGGGENRKFMKKRFVDLLLEISHLEGTFQKAALEKNLSAWKGEKNQTDDVMVIGIRL